MADIDPRKREVADRLGARWVDPDAALAVSADVFAPCALGGVLSHATIGRLSAPVVVGAANNQLATDDVAEELAAREVLWIPDFVANAAGIINIAVELRPEGYDVRQARADVLRIGDTVRLVLAEAAAASITPLEAAMRIARRRVAEGRRGGHTVGSVGSTGSSTPSGSRPSSSSLPRCEASVIVAAMRNPGGASPQTRSSRSSTLRSPSSSAATQRPLALEAVRHVPVQALRRIGDRRPVPGAEQDEAEIAESDSASR